jgi:lipoate-protein ligase A
MLQLSYDGGNKRRQSGGGTVYHDLGNTNYSIMMPRGEFDMRRSAQLVCDALRRHLDIPASLTNRNDISVKERKVSGSAYRIIQHRAFHHGTMLIDCDLQRLHRYLYAPLANNNNNNNFLAKRRIESKGIVVCVTFLYYKNFV